MNFRRLSCKLTLIRFPYCLAEFMGIMSESVWLNLARGVAALSSPAFFKHHCLYHLFEDITNGIPKPYY